MKKMIFIFLMMINPVIAAPLSVVHDPSADEKKITVSKKRDGSVTISGGSKESNAVMAEALSKSCSYTIVNLPEHKKNLAAAKKKFGEELYTRRVTNMTKNVRC